MFRSRRARAVAGRRCLTKNYRGGDQMRSGNSVPRAPAPWHCWPGQRPRWRPKCAARHRDRNQDRPDHALQRPGVGVTARSARAEVAYFKMLNERGGINGRKINLIFAGRQLRAAEDRGADADGWSESDEVALIFLLDRHRAQHRDRQIPAEQEHPAIVRRLRRVEIRRHRAISAGDTGRAGAVPLRGAALCALRAGEKSQCQIRRDLRRTTISAATICWA